MKLQIDHGRWRWYSHPWRPLILFNRTSLNRHYYLRIVWLAWEIELR